MKRFSAFLVCSTIVLVMAIAAPLRAQITPSKFIPPDISTASDINYPPNSVASGVVVVAVHLDNSGMIKSTEVLRDIPSLTAPVLLAVNGWTFKPAMLNGNGVDSTIVVGIVFNPFDYRVGSADPPDLGRAQETLQPDANGYVPAKIATASWAQYPANSVAQGAVILDVRVGTTGRVTRTFLVNRIPSLTTTSMNAAKKWTFKPAALHGSHIAANVVVGYVFRLPNSASPVAQP